MSEPARARLLGPAEIRELAERLDVSPTKKLGQNFVIDANTVRKIVKTAGVESGETVVEVGPGLGSLTLGLLEVGASVVAVEIDARLAVALPSTIDAFAPGASLTVIHQDALTVETLPGDPVRLVANLPYNVSVPVLLHFMEHFASIRSGVVMVQAEVGHRLAAMPGSKIYGSPSVKAAWYGTWRIAGTVSRQVFWPVPNVDSVLVAFERYAPVDGMSGEPGTSGLPGDTQLRRRTFDLVDAAFGQRRKMLRQALSEIFGSSTAASHALERASIAPTRRGEELVLDDFVRLASVS